MLQVKSIRKMNQHSGFPLLASSNNYSRRKGNTGLTLEQMLATTCTQIFFHTGYDVLYFGSLVSNLHRNHLSIAVLTLWVAPPKMFGSI